MTSLSLELPSRWPRIGVDAVITLVGAACVALAVWSAGGAKISSVGDYGLATALPYGYWVGLVGLNVAFVVSLGLRRTSTWVAPALVLGLVMVMHGVAAFVIGIPRTAVSYRHLGVADALASSGTLDPRIDAYFNWPGFFTALMTFTHATGIAPQTVALWAPMINVGLWCAALVVVLRAFTSDRRRVLLALWLFVLGNWIDQDYLSPQAMGLFLHLAVLGLALTLLAARPAAAVQEPESDRWRSRWRSRWNGVVPAEPDPQTRVVALLVALVLSASIVASHQLTPFMLMVSLAALVLVRRSWARWLPAILALMVVFWLTYPASGYLFGHPILGLDSADVAAANVSDRVAGAEGHIRVIWVRMTVTVALWVFAIAGAVRDHRDGTRDPRPYLLAVLPFSVLLLQSYGGEMLLRVALFALPFVTYLAARALLPPTALSRRHISWRYPLLALLCSALAVGGVVSKYGNASFDMFTAAELQASDQLYELAPDNAMLVAGGPSTPWANRDYTRFTHRTLQTLCESDLTPPGCLHTLVQDAKQDKGGMMLLLTNGNRTFYRLQGLMPASDFDRLEADLSKTAGVTLMFKNKDARVYHLSPTIHKVSR